MSSLLDDASFRSAVVPISVAQYRQMGEAGIIDEQTELIDGFILKKRIKSPLHTLCVKNLVSAIQSQLPIEYELRKEEIAMSRVLSTSDSPRLSVDFAKLTQV